MSMHPKQQVVAAFLMSTLENFGALKKQGSLYKKGDNAQLIDEISLSGQRFLPTFITDALIEVPEEDYATLIRSLQSELDMDVDVLQVEAAYEAQSIRVAELAAGGEVEPVVYVPLGNDLGGAQLEAALALDPTADFFEIDVGDVDQIQQHRSSFLDIMLREAEAAGFPYDRIHLGDNIDSQDWDSMEFDEQIDAGLPVYNIVMDNADYFTEKLKNGTFDQHALSQFLQASRDDPVLGEIFSTARKEDLSGVFEVIHNNRVPLGDFKPEGLPREMDPTLVEKMVRFLSNVKEPSMDFTMKELHNYFTMPTSAADGAVRGATAPVKIPFAVTRDLFVFRNWFRSRTAAFSLKHMDASVRGWNHFFATQQKAAISATANAADRGVRKTNEVASAGFYRLGQESKDLLTHSLAAFGRLLVNKFEKKYPDQTFLVEEVQLQQRDPWTGEITSVDPNDFDRPSSFVDRMARWATQKTNIIRRAPRAVNVNVQNAQAQPEGSPALGGSSVFGGPARSGRTGFTPNLGASPVFGAGQGGGSPPTVITMGIDQASVEAAIETMGEILAGNYEIAIGAMLTQLAAAGVYVGVEMLDYFMQVAVTDPAEMTEDRWDSILKEMRALSSRGVSQAEGYSALRESVALEEVRATDETDARLLDAIMDTDFRAGKKQRKKLNTAMDEFGIGDIRHALRLDSQDPRASYQLHQKVMQQHAKLTKGYSADKRVSREKLERVGAKLVAGYGLPVATEENVMGWARAERQYNRALAQVLFLEQQGETFTVDTLDTWFPEHGDWPDQDIYVTRYAQLAGPDQQRRQERPVGMMGGGVGPPPQQVLLPNGGQGTVSQGLIQLGLLPAAVGAILPANRFDAYMQHLAQQGHIPGNFLLQVPGQDGNPLNPANIAAIVAAEGMPALENAGGGGVIEESKVIGLAEESKLDPGGDADLARRLAENLAANQGAIGGALAGGGVLGGVAAVGGGGIAVAAPQAPQNPLGGGLAAGLPPGGLGNGWSPAPAAPPWWRSWLPPNPFTWWDDDDPDPTDEDTDSTPEPPPIDPDDDSTESTPTVDSTSSGTPKKPKKKKKKKKAKVARLKRRQARRTRYGYLDETRTLRQMFDDLDKDHDKELTSLELESLANRYGMRADTLLDLMDGDDPNRTVDFDEFKEYMLVRY